MEWCDVEASEDQILKVQELLKPLINDISNDVVDTNGNIVDDAVAWLTSAVLETKDSCLKKIASNKKALDQQE